MTLKTIDLSAKITALDGTIAKEDGREISYAQLISNILVMGNSTEPVKLFDIATRLFKDEKIELDETDMNLLRAQVINNNQITTLAKAPVIKVIDAALREENKE